MSMPPELSLLQHILPLAVGAAISPMVLVFQRSGRAAVAGLSRLDRRPPAADRSRCFCARPGPRWQQIRPNHERACCSRC